jgi:hypothetical protein
MPYVISISFHIPELLHEVYGVKRTSWQSSADSTGEYVPRVDKTAVDIIDKSVPII